MTVEYEWCLEARARGENEDEDEILDLHHDKLPQLLKMMGEPNLEEGQFCELCLVRNKLDQSGSLIDRTWAYLEGGELPEFFEDAFNLEATKVPKQYHEELANAKKVNNPF
ncbi:MAG: hypothetical protein ACRCTP_04300 [Aeromonas popoffii]|uniref:hypothetical protein n=1 Tax=Aeromonas popoffii TaxID=70856 RepID=UPI003F2A6D22